MKGKVPQSCWYEKAKYTTYIKCEQDEYEIRYELDQDNEGHHSIVLLEFHSYKLEADLLEKLTGKEYKAIEYTLLNFRYDFSTKKIKTK